MAQRSCEGQMDFEYNNKTGPVDSASPWLQRTLASGTHTTDNLKKRSFIDFYSPEKVSAFSESSKPVSIFDCQPSSTKFFPITPRNLAWAPRNFDAEYVSSGAENNSSPENHADSEATPDLTTRRLFADVKAFTHATESSGSSRPVPSTMPASHTSNEGVMLRRPEGVMKRFKQDRRKEQSRRSVVRRNSTATDSDTDDIQTRRTRKYELRTGDRPGLIAYVFGLIESHPNVPHLLSYYAQSLLNCFLVFFMMYIIWSVWSVFCSDVDKRSEEAIINILADIAKCASDYRDNKCEKELRAPALEMACDNWERCMKKDPRSVGRAKVSAHTFAEIYNSFVEPLSWKAMIVPVLLVPALMVILNLAMGFTRDRLQQQYAPLYPARGHSTAPAAQSIYNRSENMFRSLDKTTRAEPITSQISGREIPQSPKRQLMFR